MRIVHEEWRPVVGFEGKYEVSNMGRVKSLVWGREYVLKPSRHSQGYVTVSPGGHRHQLIHRVVAQAFLGPIPDGMEVNHIDGDKQNNRADNLEYVTRRGNTLHAAELGLMRRKGEDNPAAKASNAQMKAAYALVASGVHAADAAEKVGVSLHSLRNMLTGSKWKSLGLPPIKGTPRNRVPEIIKRQIVEMRRNGATEPQICQALGTSKGTVYRVLKNA